MENKSDFRRKRKKGNFSRVMKKNAKKRRFQGNHLADDVFDYYCRVVDVLKRGFDTEEEKRLFANNVLEQGGNHEMELAGNQMVSFALEKILPLADIDHIHSFEKAFTNDLRIAFVDRFCSHVTQLLITCSANRVANEEEDVNESFALRCCKFGLNNIEEFATECYACHVVRTCLDALTIIGDKAPKELPKLFYGAVIESSLVSDLSKQELGSGLLQRILYCLKVTKNKVCQKSIIRLLDVVFAPEHTEQEDATKDDKKIDFQQIPNLFRSMPVTMLLEAAIECSEGKRFTQIYAKLFINRLVTLAKDKQSNMAVQKLIRTVQDKYEFESIFEELAPGFHDILACGNSGVLVSIATMCDKLCLKQADFITCLLKCFGLERDDKQIHLCLHTKTIGCRDESKEISEQVGLQGSLIIQSMLRFKKPIKVITSLVSMNVNVLIHLLCDPKGSHITDAFFQGEFVGEKSKDKLLNVLKGKLIQLVISKHGSRSFDHLWEGVGNKQKLAIIEELHKRESEVMASEFGRIIAYKIGLSSYRRNKEDWMKAVFTKNKKEKLFADIINPINPNT